jgi:hypothetical protein
MIAGCGTYYIVVGKISDWKDWSPMAQAPAWVELPANMPFFGTPEFKKLSIRIFLRKEFLESHSYDKVAIAIAHELSRGMGKLCAFEFKPFCCVHLDLASHMHPK